jgi:2-C-methyl-D-erythritol 4-phosphate cytidylyltransferase
VTVKRMVAVVLGGGTGTRFGAALPKQLLTLSGKTLIEHCVAAFAGVPGAGGAPAIDEILLVMPPDYHDEAKRLVGAQVGAIIAGGVTRPDSVRNALAHIGARYDRAETGVLIHDAARPLVSRRIIADCLAALAEHDAIGTAVPTSDTILAVEGGVIAHVPPRETLYRAQTPQCFRLETIARAHALAAADPAFQPTDDCGVVLRYLPGTPVHIVPGSETNLKVTYPSDLAIAEALLGQARDLRPAGQRLVRRRLAADPLRERPPREAGHHVTAADLAAQQHGEHHRLPVIGGADLDVGPAHGQVVGLHHDARPGDQEQVRPEAQVKLDVQRAVADHGLGEVELDVARGRLDLHPPRDHPAAGALNAAEALVDLHQVLGGPVDPGSEVGGEHGQLAPGARGERRLYPLVQLGGR